MSKKEVTADAYAKVVTELLQAVLDALTSELTSHEFLIATYRKDDPGTQYTSHSCCQTCMIDQITRLHRQIVEGAGEVVIEDTMPMLRNKIVH